ncbi:hypothetical protein GOBAR_AA13636 [Gossypium barbadense]|uniref:Uncharacterized protein n=1 Tax=Gossypium barbadense TaxID=3634 RepID=A0A2P5XUI7_GOSBA|nr:hypothetical protein GOBAR_AA13636 [Gossypium barbadense]
MCQILRVVSAKKIEIAITVWAIRNARTKFHMEALQMKYPKPQVEVLQSPLISSNGNQTTHAIALEGMLRQGQAFCVEDALPPALTRAATDRRCMDPP